MTPFNSEKRIPFEKLDSSNTYTYRVFSRDILKGGNIGMLAGGRGVLGVYYLLENIIGEVIVSSKF